MKIDIQHVSAGLGAVVGGAAGVVILAVHGLLLEPASWAFVLALALYGALKAWDFAADDQRFYGGFDEAPAPRPVKRRARAPALKLKESV
jgi:hypothetical protein